MPITRPMIDRHELKMTVDGRYSARPAEFWALFADPQHLERWWGPPTYPATVDHHQLAPGGSVTYSMTGPEGDRHRGWWSVEVVQAPSLLVFRDGFALEDGSVNNAMPITKNEVRIGADGASTTLCLSVSFASLDDLDRLDDMGMAAGLAAAMGQIDAALAG